MIDGNALIELSGNNQRRTLGGFCPFNDALGVVLIVHRIKLEPKRLARVFSNVFD